jgi:hypothetical protein
VSGQVTWLDALRLPQDELNGTESFGE